MNNKKQIAENAALKARADELERALAATWIIIESDADTLEWMSNCTSQKTGERLVDIVHSLLKGQL